MIAWGKALALLLTLAMSVVEYMRKRGDLADAKAIVLGENLSKVLQDVKEANAIRDRVRADLRDNPSKVRDDDGFKRHK